MASSISSSSLSASQGHLPALHSILSVGKIKMRLTLCETPQKLRECCEEIIGNPTNSDTQKGWAHFYLAKSYREENRLDQSLAAFNTALELSSQAPDDQKDQELLDQIRFHSTVVKIQTTQNYNAEADFESLQGTPHLTVPEKAYRFLYLTRSQINKGESQKAKEIFSQFLDLQNRKIPNSYKAIASRIGQHLVGFCPISSAIQLATPEVACADEPSYSSGKSKAYLKGLQAEIKGEDGRKFYKEALSTEVSISQLSGDFTVLTRGACLSIQERVHATFYMAQKCLSEDSKDEDRAFARTSLESLLAPENKLPQLIINKANERLASISNSSSKRGRDDTEEKESEQRPTKK